MPSVRALCYFKPSCFLTPSTIPVFNSWLGWRGKWLHLPLSVKIRCLLPSLNSTPFAFSHRTNSLCFTAPPLLFLNKVIICKFAYCFKVFICIFAYYFTHAKSRLRFLTSGCFLGVICNELFSLGVAPFVAK